MRSSKNCDLQFANNDIFKANYSIDVRVELVVLMRSKKTSVPK